MKNENTRRNFLSASVGAVCAWLAAKGFQVTEVRAQEGDTIAITGLTSDDSDAVYPAHVHGFQATLNMKTGEFTGATTSTVATGEQPVGRHPHAINAKVDPFDFEAVVEGSPTPVHTHLVRPN